MKILDFYYDTNELLKGNLIFLTLFKSINWPLTLKMLIFSDNIL